MTSSIRCCQMHDVHACDINHTIHVLRIKNRSESDLRGSCEATHLQRKPRKKEKRCCVIVEAGEFNILSLFNCQRH